MTKLYIQSNVACTRLSALEEEEMIISEPHKWLAQKRDCNFRKKYLFSTQNMPYYDPIVLALYPEQNILFGSSSS